jgi:hypothetical protein
MKCFVFVRVISWIVLVTYTAALTQKPQTNSLRYEPTLTKIPTVSHPIFLCGEQSVAENNDA